MPIYLYRCEKCGTKLEVLQHMDGIAQLCCGKAMTKLPTTHAVFQMKGSHGGGRSARRQWCHNWTPDSKPLAKGDN